MKLFFQKYGKNVGNNLIQPSRSGIDLEAFRRMFPELLWNDDNIDDINALNVAPNFPPYGLSPRQTSANYQFKNKASKLRAGKYKKAIE